MQTFLPYATFQQSAQCLDRQRLGKQRVEAKQILMVLTGESTAWKNHPAVRMWSGCASPLAEYGLHICQEWKRRGYKDSLEPFFRERLCQSYTEYPTWLGDPGFHRSHQSNLLRKMPEHYSQFGWNVPNDLLYVWPAGREPAKQVQKDA